MAVIFDSCAVYINQGVDIPTRIARLNSVIDLLEGQALILAANPTNASMSQYELDDGQSKIKTVYRSANSIAIAINAFETIRQRYINQGNGRMVRLVDQSNFIPPYGRSHL